MIDNDIRIIKVKSNFNNNNTVLPELTAPSNMRTLE